VAQVPFSSRLALTGGAAFRVPCRQRSLPFVERTFADDGYAGERVATAAPIAIEIVRKGGGTLAPSRSAGGNAPDPSSAPDRANTPNAPGSGRSRVPRNRGDSTSGCNAAYAGS